MNIEDTNGLKDLRTLIFNIVNNVASDNLKANLAVAPILYTLYAKHMNINPKNPNWLNRDRFVLTTKSLSASLYGILHMCDFAITKEDLKQYQKAGFITPSFLESEVTPGIDISVGDSGLGIASGVGMALTERYLRSLVEKEEDYQELIDYRTYVLCSDTDLEKGVTHEATTFAGMQKLKKLMLLCNISKPKQDITENLRLRFKMIGFHVEEVMNSENLKKVDKAISRAKKSNKPSIVFFYHVDDSDKNTEAKNTQDSQNFAISLLPFEVTKDSLIHINELIKTRVADKYNLYENTFQKAKSSSNDRLLSLLRLLINKDFTIPFESLNMKINDTYSENLLLTNHKILNMVVPKSDFVLGGCSNDVTLTKAYITETNWQKEESPLGKNIDFGAREEGMVGILNGISITGLKTHCSTKLINADNLKPALRMSALMNLPITYIFTHDNLDASKEGKLFTPIEQLATLRSIPNLITIRPCDINEVLGSWEYICKSKKTVSIVLSDEVMPKLPNTNPKLVEKGGYMVIKEQQKIDGILIATGHEVMTSMNIAIELRKENLDIRVVSMPSLNLFKMESLEYQESILPKNAKKIVIEPSSNVNFGILGEEVNVLGIDNFTENSEYNYENLKQKVMDILTK